MQRTYTQNTDSLPIDAERIYNLNLFVSFSAIHSVKYRWLWFNSRLNEVNHWTNVIRPNLHKHMHRKWFAWTIFHRNWILSTMLPSMPNFRICFLYSFGNFECFDFSEFHLTTDISTLDRKKIYRDSKKLFCWYWIKFFISICIWSKCCIHIYNLYYHFAHK